uniref:Uncharacterized protein n=1 Tax=Setaria italica TaxID=4555 RepID=K4AH31_SETIT
MYYPSGLFGSHILARLTAQSVLRFGPEDLNMLLSCMLRENNQVCDAKVFRIMRISCFLILETHPLRLVQSEPSYFCLTFFLQHFVPRNLVFHKTRHPNKP